MNKIIERTHLLLERDCIRVLGDLLGRARVRKQGQTEDRGFDLALEWADRPGLKLLVEIKHVNLLTRGHVEHLIHQAERVRGEWGQPVLVFAPWIRDDHGQEFRKKGIFYADQVGNAWLDLPATKILIDIRGRRPPPRDLEPEPGRLIEPAGLKVIHTLLTRDDVLNEPVRRLAAMTGVGPTTVALVLKQLRLAGFVEPVARRTLRLNRRKDLLEHFVRGYGLKLRPALAPVRYRHEERDPHRLLELLQADPELREMGWAVTGAMGANHLTHYLEPDTVTLHVREGLGRAPLAGQRHMKDPENGNLIVLQWLAPAVQDGTSGQKAPLATPLLIYAELLAHGGVREVEAARLIHDKFLARRDDPET